MRNRTVATFLFVSFVAWGVVQIQYFSQNDIFSHSQDAWGHLNHINLVNAGHLNPKADACWQCYQPPIYYFAVVTYGRIAGLFYKPSLRTLQLFSILLMLIFLLASILTLRKLISDQQNFIMASFIILFWPSGFINAVHISNDVAFYVFTALTFYFLTSWNESKKPLFLILTGLFSVLSPFTKGNGLLTLFSTGIIVAVFLIDSKKHAPKILTNYLICILGIVYLSFASYCLMAGLKGNITNITQLRPIKTFGGHFWDFFFLQGIGQYFSAPFVNTKLNMMGNQNIWVFLFKSSLWGSFKFHSDITARLGTILLLIVFLYTAVGFYMSFRIPNQKICWIPTILFLLGLLCYRQFIPVACTGDFRFIYPIIVPCSVFFTNTISLLQRNKHYVLLLVGLLSMTGLLVSGVITVLS